MYEKCLAFKRFSVKRAKGLGSFIGADGAD